MEPARREESGGSPTARRAQARSAWIWELHRAGLTPDDVGRVIGRTGSTIKAYRQGRFQPPPQVRQVLSAWLIERGIDPALLFDPEHAMPETFDFDAERERRGIRPAMTHPAEEEPMQITSREYLAEEELSFFGLPADPFDDPEDPEDVFLSPDLINVERAIQSAVVRRQIVVLVGEPGSGKSTLLRRFYGRSGREKRVRLVAPASLDRRRITSSALAVAIIRDLTGRDTSSMAMEPRSELLRQTLVDQDQAGLFTVLLIDEGHLLKPDALLAIKQIWDSHTLFRQLAVLVVGQRPLEAMLRSDPSVRELTGRARLLFLPRYGEAEVADYLRWWCARVGGEADRIFDAGACRALATTGEYPLWINNKAVLALRYAHQVGDHQVHAEHVGRS